MMTTQGITLVGRLENLLSQATISNHIVYREKAYDLCVDHPSWNDPIYSRRLKFLYDQIFSLNYFSFLPLELQLHVFSFIPQSELGQPARVCRLFSKIIRIHILGSDATPEFSQQLFRGLVSMYKSHLLGSYKVCNMATSLHSLARFSPYKTLCKLKSITPTDLCKILKNPFFVNVVNREQVQEFFIRFWPAGKADELIATTAFRFCIITKFTQALPLLLKMGANMEHVDAMRGNPLHLAARYNIALPEECFTSKAIAQVNDSGNMPIHTAINSDAIDYISSAMNAKKVDLTAKNRAGLKPEQLAKDKPFILLLLKN